MLEKIERTLYTMLKPDGEQSQLHDFIEYLISGMILLSVTITMLQSIWKEGPYERVFHWINVALFFFFLIEYILRLWIADWLMNDRQHPVKSRVRYFFSFWAILDFLALIPVFLGGTAIDLRIFRVLRLLRITRLTGLNKYIKKMAEVVRSKGMELLSSLVIVFIFMIASSVIIYDVESVAQPEVFSNVLKSLWWAVATVTTIGYGDIYPITALGKFVGSLISITGVLLMAIPISILTSGFIEQSKREADELELEQEDEQE